MLRTATNCTGDGFTAIFMDHFHGPDRRGAPVPTIEIDT